MPPPAVILGTPVVRAEGGTTGVSGIQWLLPVAPTVISPRPVMPYLFRAIQWLSP